jgi:hypothetical protein
MTGDPLGCEDREEFDASGLDKCLDKDSRWVSLILQLLGEICEAHERESRLSIEGNLSDSSALAPLLRPGRASTLPTVE